VSSQGPASDPPTGLPFDEDEVESKVVWIWGSPRTGSTWLLEMLCAPLKVDQSQPLGFSWPAEWDDRANALPVDEFLISLHLVPWFGRTEELTGTPRPDTLPAFLSDHPSYAFSDEFADAWRPEARRLTLVRLQAVVERARRLGLGLPRDTPLLVVKEVNGSYAADRVMSLFPRSRMIVMLRDPRDVLDSLLDARRTGAWLAGARPLGAIESAEERLELVREACRTWVAQFDVVERAFDAHDPARRRRVGYEELLADTPGTLGGLAQWLGLPATAPRMQAIAERNAFASVPEEMKGPGKHHRAASPGKWRESLTPAEQEAAQEILGSRIAELGYDAAAD
jgi:Sulfotransferase family